MAILALLAVNVYFAATRPCSSAEAVVYERYASRDLMDLWKSPLDPRLGLVYGALARISTRLGGVSELTVRAPALLGGLLFWFSLWNLCRRLPGWYSMFLFLPLSAAPWFATATGMALSIGLLVAAAAVSDKSLAGASLLMSLAIGSNVYSAGAIGIAIFLARKYGMWKVVDELLLPAVLTGVFLLLPVLLIRERPVAVASNDWGTRQVIRSLAPQPVFRIAVSPAMEPAVFFYRRRYHRDWIRIVPLSEDADFTLR